LAAARSQHYILALSIDLQELNRIGVGVEERAGPGIGAVECAGIDEVNFADAGVLGDVGVALKKIIVALLGEDSPFERRVVAVGEGELFAGQFELAEVAEAVDADGFGVALKAEAVPVAIAPDEGGFEAGEMMRESRMSSVDCAEVILACDRKLSYSVLLAALARSSSRKRMPTVSSSPPAPDI